LSEKPKAIESSLSNPNDCDAILPPKSRTRSWTSLSMASELSSCRVAGADLISTLEFSPEDLKTNLMRRINGKF
jgi:hypothetical protein